jgi:hypothetical protein
MAKTAVDRYLERFFEEKEVRYEMYEIEENGELNLIDTDYVVQAIKGAPKGEKEQIANTLRKIDFANGDVNHYLKFLAEALVKMRYTA